MVSTEDGRRWRRLIGIAGGLGPHAHLEFERRLLAAAGPVEGDQGYPPWIVSSLPETPDRTEALGGGAPSPEPWIARSLERLASAGADFAVIVCHTAHAFLDPNRSRSPLPILDLVAEAVAEIARLGSWTRVGLLATSGTLESRIYPRAGARLAPELEFLSLPELPGGDELQRRLVMEPIYGRRRSGTRIGGLKAGSLEDPVTGRRHADALAEAAARLAQAGASGVVTACTEISLALGAAGAGEVDTIDPMTVAARETIRIAEGTRDLPG